MKSMIVGRIYEDQLAKFFHYSGKIEQNLSISQFKLKHAW